MNTDQGASAQSLFTWPSVLGPLTRGENISAEAARWAMLDVAQKVNLTQRAVDIVGTGGDGHHTVNISTMAAVVVAACGIPVIKHGNRAASSKSGGADVLEALGIIIDRNSDGVIADLNRVGIGFCFAPIFHPALRYAATARQQLAVPTVFNVLGPLTNPAQPDAALIGSAFPDLMDTIAQVFLTRGQSALVVASRDGLDELSVTDLNDVIVVSHGQMKKHIVNPTDLGFARAPLDALRGGDAYKNAQVALDVWGGADGPIRDAVLLNAAGAIVAYDDSAYGSSLLDVLRDGIARSRKALDSGGAMDVARAWSEGFLRPIEYPVITLDG